MLSIENPDDTIRGFVNRYCKDAHPDDYALRTLTNFAEVRQTDTLKECLHNGMGLYYIPGSSIKGSIRTAVLSSLAKGMSLDGKIRDRSGRITAQQIEKYFFGKDPNSDVFRFLHVGDAYFTDDCGIATRMVNLNIRHKENLMDYSKSQIVEAIGIDHCTTFQVKIADSYYHWVKALKPDSVTALPQEMLSLDSLFILINSYTEELVSSEIDKWSEMKGYYEGAESYIENMYLILDKIKQCHKGKDCILRMGYGIGWRFITGGWSEGLDNFEEVISAARPKNDQYSEYVFPKSRRLDEDSDVLGFVKLSINSL